MKGIYWAIARKHMVLGNDESEYEEVRLETKNMDRELAGERGK